MNSAPYGPAPTARWVDEGVLLHEPFARGYAAHAREHLQHLLGRSDRHRTGGMQ